MADQLRRMQAPNDSSSPASGGGAFLAGVLGLAAGAALMYLFDPERGTGRRTALLDQLGGAARDVQERAQGRLEDASQRIGGASDELSYRASDELVPDEILAERVRSELGHEVVHAGAIGVEVSDGSVVLSGPVLFDEAARAVATARTVPGVRHVEDRLNVHDDPGSIPSLQG